ncbi:hypothetical protein [uncultured Deinococcus sp.]|uniref:hypothetical protein n=1 Tax=uncultured Deinococcus sp. TaxID=158789 RepID=UPI0025858A63|nr:hypothetical protein [uncultured Deinococcus sp.]
MRQIGDALPTVPVVTSLNGLLPGQVALLDNGTDPPRLVRRRLDGSVPAFVNAVSQWPMLIASLGGEDGNQTAQHVDGMSFQRILLAPTVDTHSGWDAQNRRYLAPEAGTYRIEMKMRVKDSGLPQGVSIGLGACDSGPSFLWSVSNANREGLMNQRVMALNKGDEVYLMCYIDRPSGADLAAAEMTIDKIR